MKYFLILIALVLFSKKQNAQSISRSVLPTNGGTYSGNNLQVDYTVGETITQTFTNGNFILTQGFQQPDSLIPITLNITCFLEGFYLADGFMRPALMNQGVNSDSTITDTVEIQLRGTTSPYDLVKSTKAVLHTNGNLSCKLNPSLFGHSYYLVLRHRNTVETWSALPVPLNNNSSYNFSTADTQAYGSNQVQVQTGIYALYTGDLDQTGAVDAFDYVILDPDLYNGESGYLSTDLNGDGVVDMYDYVVIDPNLYNGVVFSTP